MDRRPAIIAMLLLLLPVLVHTQDAAAYRFVNFGSKDGLNDKYIYAITQDDRGFIWLGTASGLYRYDGHNFLHVNSPADEPGHSIGNILQAVEKDGEGNLWLGSVNTLQWYNPARNRFWTPDLSRPENKTLAASYIMNITKGLAGRMWLATSYNYFFRFNRADSSFTHFHNYPPSATRSVITVYEWEGEALAVHTEGIYRFAPDGSLRQFYPMPQDAIINAAADPQRGRILLGTYTSGLFFFYPLGGEYKTDYPGNLSLKNNNILSVAVDSQGRIYTGTYRLDRFDNLKQEHLSFSKNSGDEYSLGVSKIVRLYFDREGNCWIGSHFGLSLLPWQNNQVSTINLFDPVSRNTVEPAGVFGIPGTGEILITNTSTAGLIVLDGNSGNLFTVVNPAGKSVQEKRIIGLIAAPDNQVYVSDDLHLYKYLPGKRTLVPYPLADQDGKPLVRPTRSVFDPGGTIYIGSENNGFYTWKYPSGKLVHFNKWEIDRSLAPGSDNNLVPCLVDRRNGCWFTSVNGLYRYDPARGSWRHIAARDTNGVMAPGATDYAAEDKRGHIWFVSRVSGLYEWYLENGKEVLKQYTRSSGIGLPADYCWKIRQSPLDSCLWISNIAGLLKFDPVQRRVLSVYTRQNGLNQDDGGYTFNFLPDGRLAQLFYGVLNLVDLPRYRENRVLPVVRINSVKALDREYVYNSDESPLFLRLSSRENYLHLAFAALVFNNGNRNQYAWKMEGADQDWVYGGTTNQVSYPALRPGHYTFRVKAANNDGYWGPETVVRFVIRPPFYATPWFIGSTALLLLLLLYAWYRSRLRRATREARLKAEFRQQLAETEMKALRAQMNPHFIFNSLNSIQKYILKNEQEAASQYLTKFSRLIRLILDHSDQNWVSLAGELELLRLYLEMESMRFDDQFDYHVGVDVSLHPDTVEIPSMVIQPYVENAIWHGLLHRSSRGKLELSFTPAGPGMLRVIIEDNGVGREKAAELKSKQVLRKKSYGMQITENRIAAINRLPQMNARAEVTDLYDAGGQSAGTRVELVLPLKSLTV